MYRSKYNFKPAKDRHEILETIESTVHKHLQKLDPRFFTLEIPYDVRNRHIYIVGKTQHGKSTLLQSIISQDIEIGAGVCVIDPKPSGHKPNLVDSILEHIPESRKDDVIYFDAANPVPIDVMDWETEQERQTLASDLMQTFMQFQTQKDGDRWPGILRYAIHALLEAKDCTFLDLHDFLADETFRKKILLRVKRPHLLKYWLTTYPLFPKDAAIPILNRMATFILVPPISIMLGTAKPDLRIEDVIRGRKILLVNLTGAGKESGNFVGTLFVSRIQQAIFRRLRIPFHLFADEFQNFQTSAFDTILSEAGGLGLRLTLANQYVYQLDERIRQSVFGNVSSFFVFNIDDADTRYFKSKMPLDVHHEQLAHQQPYQALYAIASQEPRFKSIPKPPPDPTPQELSRADYIRKRTLDIYGCKAPEAPHTPRSETEKPEPEATLPDDPRKAPSASAPQRVFRPHDKHARHSTKSPDSN